MACAGTGIKLGVAKVLSEQSIVDRISINFIESPLYLVQPYVEYASMTITSCFL
jgi:hypothetical protein